MFSVFLSSIMVVAHIIQTTIYINDMTSALDEAWMIGLFMLNLLENCQIEDAFKCQKRHILFFFSVWCGNLLIYFREKVTLSRFGNFPIENADHRSAAQLASQLPTTHFACLLHIIHYIILCRDPSLHSVHYSWWRSVPTPNIHLVTRSSLHTNIVMNRRGQRVSETHWWRCPHLLEINSKQCLSAMERQCQWR